MRKGYLFSFILIILFVSLACSMPFMNDDAGKNTPVPRATISGEDGVQLTPQIEQKVVEPQAYPTEEPPFLIQDELPTIEVTSSDEPGKVCFLTIGQGISCLTADGWQNMNVEMENLVSDYVDVGTKCGDALVLAMNDQLTVIDVDFQARYIPLPEEFYYSIEDISCKNTGDIWLAHFEGVSHYADGAWETYWIKDIVTENLEFDSVEGILVDERGSIWAALSNHIVKYSDGSWMVFGEGQGFSEKYFLEDIIETSQGEIYAAASMDLLHYENNQWVAIPYPSFETIVGITSDSDGDVWVYGLGIIWEYQTAVKEWVVYSPDLFAENQFSDRINDLVIDGQGRFWFVSNWGTAVWDGEIWQVFFRHNSPMLSSKNNQVIAFGGGFPIPEPEEIRIGDLKGAIFDESESPLAGVTVQACVEMVIDFELGYLEPGERPCDKQAYQIVVSTDDYGAFYFPGLLAGDYYLVVEVEPDDWLIYENDYGFAKDVMVTDGAVTDLGNLFVSFEE